MITFSTWEFIGIVVLVMVLYTVTLVVGAKFVGKGFASKMMYLLPVYPLDTAKRIYAIARQLGIKESDIAFTGKNKYTGKSEYLIKSTEQVVTVDPFFGVVIKEDGEPLNREYHAFSAESMTQQHNYIEKLKEQGTPLQETQETETTLSEEPVQEVINDAITEVEETVTTDHEQLNTK